MIRHGNQRDREPGKKVSSPTSRSSDVREAEETKTFPHFLARVLGWNFGKTLCDGALYAIRRRGRPN